MNKITHLQLAKDRKDDEFKEQYSVKNYFVRVLLNFDPSKIKFLTKNESGL